METITKYKKINHKYIPENVQNMSPILSCARLKIKTRNKKLENI